MAQSEMVAQKSLEKAIRYFNIDNSRSFVHFLVALNLHAEWKTELTSMFISLTDKLSRELLLSARVNDFFNCFEQAFELYPDNPELKRCFSKHLQNLGYSFKAFVYLNSAVKLKPEEPLWNRELDNVKNILVERWHYRMLNDSIRNNAYKNAISQCVDSSSCVLDIGCGSGLLSLYVAENNPKRQVAVEYNEALYNIATTVFHDNQLKNIIVKNAMSTALNSEDILGKVSIIVTEIFDGGFFGEGILQTMIHAHKCLLENIKINPIVIPKSARLYVCGLESRILSKKHCVVDSVFRDLMKMENLIIYKNIQETYDTEDLTLIKDLQYSTDAQTLLSVDFLDLEHMEKLYRGEEKLNAKLKMNMSANIHAFGIWFDLQVCDNIKLTTDPREKNRAKAWEQAIIYLNKPVSSLENSIIDVSLNCELGKLKMINYCVNSSKSDNSNDYTYYEVPLEIIRLLNDNIYYTACDMAVSALCIHLSQMFALKDVNVLDLSSFPIIGFLLLKRGIHMLTCCTDLLVVKKMILEIAALNGIDENKICFAEKIMNVSTNRQQYNVIINNDLINFDLYSNQMKQFLNLKNCMETFNGVAIPYKIRMKGVLIYSDEIERVNRVNNVNVSNYKIAESMNVFQVGQNYISDKSILYPYASMSNEIIIFEQFIGNCVSTIIDIEIIKNGHINAVLCWCEIQLLENCEVYSTLESDSFLDCTLHILELNLSGYYGQKGSLLVCVDDNNIKLAVDLDGTIS